MAGPSWIWKETAEVIGVLGVIASLIFVALEIRQNTDAIRSATVQDISRWSYDASMAALEYPELISARKAACTGDLTEDQRPVLFVYYASLLRLQANRFQQAQLGILDEDLALNLGGRGGAYTNPFFVEAWSILQDDFGPDFRKFIEETVVPLSREGCRPDAPW